MEELNRTHKDTNFGWVASLQGLMRSRAERPVAKPKAPKAARDPAAKRPLIDNAIHLIALR